LFDRLEPDEDWKMRVDVVLGIVSLAGLAACTAAEPRLSDAEREVIEASVDSAMHAFENAERSRDLDALISHFAQVPEFRVYSDGVRVDYESLVAQIRSTFPAVAQVEGGFESIEVSVLGRDAAVASASFQSAVTDTSGATYRQRGAATWVWVRQDGGWRILNGHVDHYPDVSP
jgi:ketosteroid isomerase-like protein